MRQKGHIKQWNEATGFGVISPAAGGREVFLHIEAFTSPQQHPAQGDEVSYELANGDELRPRAENVSLLPARSTTTRKWLTSTAATMFLGVLWYGANQALLPHMLFWGYFSMSLLTLLCYAWDKSAALKGLGRIAEHTLHGLALCGGWPGALCGRHLFRHKTRKQPFRAIFWVTVALNLAVLVFLVTPYGLWLEQQIFLLDVVFY